MQPRTPSHHEADTRRVIKGREPEWLRGYIARKALAMLIADQELADQGKERMLAKSSIEMLKQLRGFASKPTGREHKPRIPSLEEA